jgi:hypothetical protein
MSGENLKQAHHPRLFTPLAVATALGLIVAFGPAQQSGVSAQVNPPAPPGPAGVSTPAPTLAPLAPVPSSAPSDLGTPTATPSPSGGRHGHHAPSSAPSASPEPSATPTSPAFATLDGTWEFQLQYINRTEYSYLTIAQQPAGTISGFWKVNGHDNPFEGTYDGRLIRIIVKEPTGNVTMSGYVEGASDMVGIVDLGKEQTANVAFTAEHRGGNKGSMFKKSK